MTLTTNDYYEIAAEITSGANYIEYAKDNEVLFIDCELTTDGYTESETDAYIETERTLHISSVESWTADGDRETENNFNTATLQEVA